MAESLLPDRTISNTGDLRLIASRNDTVCTYTYLKTNHVQQEFFRCRTCFNGAHDGCCHVCARTCHAGHDTVSIGLCESYCDCGLTVCSIKCKNGPKCTYDGHGKGPKYQKWFKCQTCWGEDSVFGCCETCAKECHKDHTLVPQLFSSMICNCGHNNHRPNVCTLYTTGRKFQKQPFYFCSTCFTNPVTEGCCYQCMKECHAGHRVLSKGVRNAYCDCGRMASFTNCKIAEPQRN